MTFGFNCDIIRYTKRVLFILYVFTYNKTKYFFTSFIEVTEPIKTVLIEVTEPIKTVLIEVTEPIKTVLIEERLIYKPFFFFVKKDVII